MLFTLASVLLMQAPSPSLAVMTTRRTGVSQSQGVDLAADVERVLAAEGIVATLPAGTAEARLAAMGTKDAAICQAKKACVLELGRQLSVDVMVSVSAAKLAGDLGLSIEAVRIRDGVVLASATPLLSGGAPLQPGQLLDFAAKLREAYGLPSPMPKPIEEPKPEVKPAFSEPPPPTPLPERSHGLGYAFAVGAIASLAAGIAFSALAALDAQDLFAKQSGNSIHRYSEAVALAQRGNAFITAAMACGIAGVVLGVAAAVAW